jgi:hypothetical protein
MFTAEDLKVMREMAREMYVNHEITPDAYAVALEDLKLAERRAHVTA